MGSKYLDYNPGSELNLFSLNNDQWTMEKQKNWMKQKSNKRWTEKLNNEQNKLNNNNKYFTM